MSKIRYIGTAENANASPVCLTDFPVFCHPCVLCYMHLYVYYIVLLVFLTNLCVVLQTTRPQMTGAGDGPDCCPRAKWCYSSRSPITVNGYPTADFLPCTSVGGKSSPPDPCPTRMRRRYWTTFTTAKSRLECWSSINKLCNNIIISIWLLLFQ